MIVYVSHEDGAIYLKEHVDNPNDTEHFWPMEIPDVVTLTPEDLCSGYGNIAEILLRAGQGKRVLGP